jgi:hypothetical protein
MRAGDYGNLSPQEQRALHFDAGMTVLGAAGTVGLAGRAGAVKGAATGAESAVNGLKLNKALASQAQMGEVGTMMAGAGVALALVADVVDAVVGQVELVAAGFVGGGVVLAAGGDEAVDLVVLVALQHGAAVFIGARDLHGVGRGQHVAHAVVFDEQVLQGVVLGQAGQFGG